MTEPRGAMTAEPRPAASALTGDQQANGQIVRATDLTGVHILKHDNLFMLCDAYGDIHVDRRGLGLYERDTRVLSLYELRLNGVRPVVLRTGPAVAYRSTIQLTNPDQFSDDGDDRMDRAEMVLRRHSLGMVRERVIGGGFGERVTIRNYTTRPERARLTLKLDADYADIFELRGLARDRRGVRLPTEGDANLITFAYRGVDGAVRRTHVRFSTGKTIAGSDTRVPSSGPVALELDVVLEPGEWTTLSIDVWSELPQDLGAPDPATHDDPEDSSGARVVDEAATALDEEELSVGSDDVPRDRPPISADEAAAMHRAWRSTSASIETGEMLVDRAFDRASADLRLLVNTGPRNDERYVAGGVPWFSALFGRDSLITGLQTLFVRPQLARSTLLLLARLQATEVDKWREAQPGKILHELRQGEMAATGEIPQGPYYGAVDATPLWLVLLDTYERWTGDDELVDRLWPHALSALRWMDEYGDPDRDGFIEYERSSFGLLHQGWKDSPDSVRRRDGTMIESSIALVEVQGYAYAARRAIARLARIRRDDALADAQEVGAERLRTRFEDAFWMPDAGTYALALDADKRQVDALASNAGHALWSGICSPDRAASVARVLMGPGMWSGWGVRTLASTMTGYNPIGYHVGAVWPHDNGILAAGFSRYGLIEEARIVCGTLLEATMHFREARLPELFCGFDRDQSPMPVPYPVACTPQAWASGSLFHVLGALLGLRPDAREKRLEIVRPTLPASLAALRVRNLRVGDALVDLEFAAHNGSISVEVLRRSGDLDVLVRL